MELSETYTDFKSVMFYIKSLIRVHDTPILLLQFQIIITHVHIHVSNDTKLIFYQFTTDMEHMDTYP